ncbi:aminotransferase class I/II-fold pyridoxal phosphate-dependent enzyme [Nocardiopsis ansamitocini]|uniref:GntR family transcriptional regulator n=1 Tax=Nocardiopsis ansamitocini TaxID=1670832 RepID=A0A9W6P5R9_9ACTN|nr:aminotransferase class I/II-fold pyridoxal phosphate-dependent enzyme [Nocardiopsis ansamitocini]GLU47557.1 GntR family transcriptional regulator [Nocardiopsis ansamitocini]
MVISGRGSHEIADSVERSIITGDMGPGTALPPIRDLAGTLRVNATTVATAYRLLRDRGLVETAGRRGTRVRAQHATAPREAGPRPVRPGTHDAASGNPDPRLLPDLGPALAAVAARRSGRHPLYDTPPVGTELLSVAREVFGADGVPADEVTVTSGALDAIDRLLRSGVRPGDAVALEDPGWHSELDLVASLGLKRLAVEVDDEGMLPGELAKVLRSGARAVIVTNRAQNPVGSVLSAERAAALRAELAEHQQVLTIEDDHGFGFVAEAFHCLAGATRRWAVVRTAAKGYGPDLRLGLVAGDPVTVDRMRAGHRLGPGWVSHVLQETFAELWRSRAVDPVRVDADYAKRRTALIRALREHKIPAFGRSGVNVWVRVPDEAVAVARLMGSGWAVTPGSRFRTDTAPGIRVTISNLDTGDMPGLADAVADAVNAAGPHV